MNSFDIKNETSRILQKNRLRLVLEEATKFWCFIL